MTYECPNCGSEYTEEQVENDEGVVTRTSNDPYSGIAQDSYFCGSCVESYNEDSGLLRRFLKGKTDRLDFKLRKK